MLLALRRLPNLSFLTLNVACLAGSWKGIPRSQPQVIKLGRWQQWLSRFQHLFSIILSTSLYHGLFWSLCPPLPSTGVQTHNRNKGDYEWDRDNGDYQTWFPGVNRLSNWMSWKSLFLVFTRQKTTSGGDISEESGNRVDIKASMYAYCKKKKKKKFLKRISSFGVHLVEIVISRLVGWYSE